MSDSRPLLTPLQAPSDLCKCGHPKGDHTDLAFVRDQRFCPVLIDKRHSSGGGSTLYPCDCKGYDPMFEVHR